MPEELACLWKSYGGRKSATQAGLKLHVCFDLRTGQLWGPAITDGKHNDHHSPFRDQGLPKGSLKCSDLGYFDAHLVKPVDRDILTELIAKHRGTRHSAEPEKVPVSVASSQEIQMRS